MAHARMHARSRAHDAHTHCSAARRTQIGETQLLHLAAAGDFGVTYTTALLYYSATLLLYYSTTLLLY